MGVSELLIDWIGSVLRRLYGWARGRARIYLLQRKQPPLTGIRPQTLWRTEPIAPLEVITSRGSGYLEDNIGLMLRHVCLDMTQNTRMLALINN